MTTIELEDSLINKVLKTGHYQNAQKAISSILSDYVQSQKVKDTLFDKLHVEVDMSDDEIDTLFERNKDTGRTVDL